MNGQLDPTKAAGFRLCYVCGSEASPTCAAWIDDDAVLATMPQQCEHLSEMVVVITPSRLLPVDGGAR